MQTLGIAYILVNHIESAFSGRNRIYGTFSGQGRAAARLFAAEGAQVLAVDHLGDAVCAVAEELGSTVLGLAANAGNEADVQAMIARAASKAGVISLVQTTANALSGTGVRVNAVCPGLIETGMTKPLFEAARARGSEARIGQLNPTERAGQPEEIAAAALFLASDEASYVQRPGPGRGWRPVQHPAFQTATSIKEKR